MKCVIQWIDEEGKPTPDSNDAVMMAHYHRPRWSLPGGGPGNTIIGYEEEIERSFPMCKEHYDRHVTPKLLWPLGGWSFEAIPSSNSLTPQTEAADAAPPVATR